MRWFKKTLEMSYSEEYAPYVLKEIADCQLDYKVRWTREMLIGYHPYKVYTAWTMHLTIPNDEVARLVLHTAQREAAKKSWADDDRRRDAQANQK